MNIKICISSIVLIFMLGVGFLDVPYVFAADNNSYTLLESIPGGPAKGTQADFSSYIQGVFNFLVGFVIFAALLMIVIGGFYYITSAGNQAQAGTAKKIITDALLGLIVVFLTYLILFTINADLVGTSPNMDDVQKTATQNSAANNLQSQVHSSSRVSQTPIQPQTYCTSDGVCKNSFADCQSAGSGCKPSQSFFSNSSYYANENGKWTEYQNLGECTSGGASCVSGAQAKADVYNNVKSDAEVTEELTDSGVEVADTAKDDAGKMTQKTVDTVKEVVKESDGGTVTDVGSDGATVNMQGARDSKNNGTEYAEGSQTVKGLQDMYKKGESNGEITRTKEKKGKITYYKYEFSPDHPNKNLAGTVATYSVTEGFDEGLVTKKYSDVKITAAQSIATCTTSGC